MLAYLGDRPAAGGLTPRAPPETVASLVFSESPAASTIARRSVELRTLPWVRRLAADYADQYAALASFFAGDPSSPTAWHESVTQVRAARHDRESLVRVLAAQQDRRNAPPEARAAASRLHEGGTLAVVTGQQAGLFGGPLFTLLKAVAAVRIAASLERELGAQAVPIFWIDAEDHDWEEVRDCTVLDGELRPRTVRLAPPPGAGELPVGALQLSDEGERAVAELEQALPATEYTPELIAALRDAYARGMGVADAFGRLLERVLGPAGLIVFDSSDRAAKRLVSHVFAQELAVPGRSAALALDAGSKLDALGYHAQVQPHRETVGLFRLDGGRRSIRTAGDALRVGEEVVPLETLRSEALERPERFSPNVLLRPIVQDTLFPTVCYVAGPNELAYLGQLRGIYQEFGLPMPLMIPRPTATVLDSPASKFLARYDVPFEAFGRQDESALNQLLEAQLPPSVEASYEAAVRAVRERLEAVIAAVPAIDPTLEGAARSTLGRMEHDLQTLHSKIIQAAKRRDETLRRQFSRTRALIAPNGQPQERALGFVYFLNRYGSAFVDRLLAELPIDGRRHWLLSL